MASPPGYPGYPPSFSPPASSHTSHKSKKRPSDVSSAPSQKRRKPSLAGSSLSISSHPLRQTSFPPEAYDNGARSPSVDTMSMVSGSVAAAPVKSKRGRKPKNRGDDNASLVGGKAGTVISSKGSKAKGGKKDQRKDEDEDLDDDDGNNAVITITARTAEEKEKEKQHRALLVSAFDTEQFSRFEVWRSSRLTEGVVRRLVNQTLSQSVPVGVILAVKSVAKLWAGEIIERARKVQSQWLELSQEDQTSIPSTTTSFQTTSTAADSSNSQSLVQTSQNHFGTPTTATSENASQGSQDRGISFLPSARSEEEAQYRKELNRKARGPLTPEHLREALRRIKMERDGGVGLLGLGRLQHSTGQERFGLRVGGKKLFR